MELWYRSCFPTMHHFWGSTGTCREHARINCVSPFVVAWHLSQWDLSWVQFNKWWLQRVKKTLQRSLCLHRPQSLGTLFEAAVCMCTMPLSFSVRAYQDAEEHQVSKLQVVSVRARVCAMCCVCAREHMPDHLSAVVGYISLPINNSTAQQRHFLFA